ncbi:hypothetical protein TRIUR3_06328 [Triticum urartu]|uniref:Uncharacterized protein n=1 Tax=Triticum urartu TaxID=4572 RepID=M7ZXK7_TRIUA|nr:hypothetical protein TRIUR3_06328 [Triticum urartu]
MEPAAVHAHVVAKFGLEFNLNAHLPKLAGPHGEEAIRMFYRMLQIKPAASTSAAKPANLDAFTGVVMKLTCAPCSASRRAMSVMGIVCPCANIGTSTKCALAEPLWPSPLPVKLGGKRCCSRRYAMSGSCSAAQAFMKFKNKFFDWIMSRFSHPSETGDGVEVVVHGATPSDGGCSAPSAVAAGGAVQGEGLAGQKAE